MDSSKNQTGSAVVKIIVGVLLGLLVLIASSIIVFITGVSELMHAGMFFVSFILILFLSRGKISEYGFKITDNLRLKQTIIVGSVAGLIITGSALVFPVNAPPGVEEFSFVQAVIFVWIYASICEEVLTRGLIFGYLSPLKRYSFLILKLRISLPVLVSALFFGAMHLGLLSVGLDSFSVSVIVVSGFIMGVIAGYYREKTESIIPAIIVHMLFNICGSIIGLIKNLI